MFVMGIPLVFFMIGLLYFVIGLGEELVLRERIQDAADAGAITGAMVYARGMNLIALVNQLMAALVGLLIMVRMLEAVMTATIIVATALAWPTGGASLSVVPGVEVVREEANVAYTELKEVVDPIVQALHGLELGIQYGMPAIAELQTIDIIKSFGDPVSDAAVPGFEIPGQLFLPLKNGKWPRLCEKAGEAAASLITMPIGAIIPIDQVRDVISAGLGGLTKTFSGYFCDSGSGTGLSFPEKLPSVPIPEDVQFNENLPPLASTKECEQQSQNAPQGQGYDRTADGLTRTLTEQEKQQREQNRSARQEQIDEVCFRAATDLAMSQMSEDGGPMTVNGRAAGKNEGCAVHWSDGTTYNCPSDCRGASVCSQFQTKVNGAYEVCGPGKKEGIVSYNYQRRDLMWEVELEPLPGCTDPNNCRYNVRFVTPEPTFTDVAVQAKDPPCGSKDATIGRDYVRTGYRANGRYADDEYVCSTPHNYVDPSDFETSTGAATSGYTLDAIRKQFGSDDPDSGWALSMDGSGAYKLVGTWSAVTYMHSCDKRIKNLQDTSGKMTEEPKPPTKQQDDCEDSEDEVHLEMEDATEDNVLGGKIFQIRSIAFRREPDTFAREVVRTLPMRTQNERGNEPDNPLSAAGDVLRSFFAAQAEYYFDSGYEKHTDRWDQTSTDRKEWAWHMKWKARLRRLRFMGDDTENSTCGDGWQSQGTRLKDKPQDKCNNNSGGGSSSSGGGSGSSSGGSIAKNTQDVISDKLGLAGGQMGGNLDVSSQFGDAFGGGLQQLNGTLQGANLPGAGGAQGGQGQSGSGQSAACGSVSATRQLESLIIH